MIYHYLKIAFRNLIKYKTQSIVSIVGLAIGFTCFALSPSADLIAMVSNKSL